jgi:hypothetical protein
VTGVQTCALPIYKAPPLMGIRDASNGKLILDDMAFTDSYNNTISALGGSYDSTKYEYNLNLGNHIHQFMQDKSGSKFGDRFYIFAANRRYYSSSSSILITDYAIQTPGRVILNNSGATKPPYLRIVYSKIIE